MMNAKPIIFIVLFLLALWCAGFAAVTIHDPPSAPSRALEKTDAVIVFTGGYDRINTGLGFLANQQTQKILISGVHENIDEAALRSFWKDQPALPQCCITLDYKAQTTRQNAIESAEWMKKNNIRTIRLVTSDYHMRRALMELTAITPDIDIIPVPVQDNKNAPTTFKFWSLSIGEYNKLLYRFLTLQIGQLKEPS